MKTKHTPGPWKAESASGFASSVITAPTWENPIAMVNDHPDRYYRVYGPATEEGEARKAFVVAEKLANARLIAAAPELLDALRNLVAVQPNLMANSAEIADARAAIAKTVQS